MGVGGGVYKTFQPFKSGKKKKKKKKEQLERVLLTLRVGTNRWANGPPDRKIWVKGEVKNGENLRKTRKNGGKMRFGRERNRNRFCKNQRASRSLMPQHEAVWTCFFDMWNPHATSCQFWTAFDHFDPYAVCSGTNGEWHANQERFRNARERVQKSRKSGREKIESFILCPTLFVPNKERATVITLFLPLGFPRVLARKTRQPD